jgi:hypothetical protein
MILSLDCRRLDSVRARQDALKDGKIAGAAVAYLFSGPEYARYSGFFRALASNQVIRPCENPPYFAGNVI